MTPLLVILYGFLGLFFAVTGYCFVALLGSPDPDVEPANMLSAEPSPAA